MKKIFAIIAFSALFMSCGQSSTTVIDSVKTDTTTVDSTKIETPGPDSIVPKA